MSHNKQNKKKANDTHRHTESEKTTSLSFFISYVFPKHKHNNANKLKYMKSNAKNLKFKPELLPMEMVIDDTAAGCFGW